MQQIRPAEVPRSAVWFALAQEWRHVDRDYNGRPMGKETSWHRDGVVKGYRQFRHGQLHGKYALFHDNGDVAKQGSYILGHKHGLERVTRSAASTRVAWFPTRVLQRILGPMSLAASDVWVLDSWYSHGELQQVTAFTKDRNRFLCRRSVSQLLMGNGKVAKVA